MNKYQLLNVIGEGAYGVVLKCRNKETGEIVAIKKFKESDEDEIVRKTTLREVKMLRLLRQENIVDLKEAFRRKQKLCLVFEFVEHNLLEVLELAEKLTPDQIRSYILQLVKALAWCHHHNIVHRDIKPENLLITGGGGTIGKLKLCDFGFARQLPTQRDVSITDYVSTRWYRAPELLLGSTHYGAAVDMWAVGCIMGELVDGMPVFPGETDMDQLYIVQRLLGTLTREQTQLFSRNPRFAGQKFPDLGGAVTLDRKYGSKMAADALAFLKNLLQMNPSHRLTCAQCLAHPYLAALQPPQQAAGLPRSERSSSSVSTATAAHPDSGARASINIAPRETVSIGVSPSASPPPRGEVINTARRESVPIVPPSAIPPPHVDVVHSSSAARIYERPEPLEEDEASLVSPGVVAPGGGSGRGQQQQRQQQQQQQHLQQQDLDISDCEAMVSVPAAAWQQQKQPPPRGRPIVVAAAAGVLPGVSTRTSLRSSGRRDIREMGGMDEYLSRAGSASSRVSITVAANGHGGHSPARLNESPERVSLRQGLCACQGQAATLHASPPALGPVESFNGSSPGRRGGPPSTSGQPMLYQTQALKMAGRGMSRTPSQRDPWPQQSLSRNSSAMMPPLSPGWRSSSEAGGGGVRGSGEVSCPVMISAGEDVSGAASSDVAVTSSYSNSGFAFQPPPSRGRFDSQAASERAFDKSVGRAAGLSSQHGSFGIVPQFVPQGVQRNRNH